MCMDSRCRVLAWDSEFFGRRIAQLTGPHLRDAEVKDIVAWSRAERIECLYFLAASDCPETLSTAQRHGFEWVDLRVTCERKSTGNPKSQSIEPVKVRPHTEADLPSLAGIARGLRCAHCRWPRQDAVSGASHRRVQCAAGSWRHSGEAAHRTRRPAAHRAAPV